VPVTYTFLVNDRAGGDAAVAADRAAQVLIAAGQRVRVEAAEDTASTLLSVDAACSRSDVVVAVGGDGTVASVAGQVAAQRGVLGLVPAGRGNDFARMLGVPSDPEEAARVLLDRHVRTVDLVRCAVPGAAPRVVVGSVYSGVDAQAVELVEEMRWLPHLLQYPAAAVRALASYRPVRAEVVVDGVPHDVTAATVVVANSAYYGSGMRIAPDASVTDGLLDVVVVAASSRRTLITAMPTIYNGSHVRRSDVTVLRGKVVEVRGAPAVPMGADGEPLGTLPAPDAPAARIEVLPAALRVLTPSP
jgi:YegS/Rv2252/BmrU family lipid kinase